MVDAGVGGVLISDVNAGIPHSDVSYMSDEWLDNIVSGVDRLGESGMLAAMECAPGYPGVGSTWLPANMSMKELTRTETRVSANASSTVFQQPFSKLGDYHNLFALAYPVQPGEGEVFRDAMDTVSISGTKQNTSITTTINRANPLRLSSGQSLEITMKDAFVAQAVAIYRLPETPTNAFDGARDFPPAWVLQISNDSSAWDNVRASGSFPAL